MKRFFHRSRWDDERARELEAHLAIETDENVARGMSPDGARLLQRNPGFAAVAILSLALGVGANTAIFQLLDALRIRTLPVWHPESLVEIRIADDQESPTGEIGRA